MSARLTTKVFVVLVTLAAVWAVVAAPPHWW
jgi:hypothetical protein